MLNKNLQTLAAGTMSGANVITYAARVFKDCNPRQKCYPVNVNSKR